MLLRIRHLGQIKSADFRIRNLTLFTGENSTNKSWVAYTLYALMSSMAGGGRFSSAPGAALRHTRLRERLRENAQKVAASIARAQGESSLYFEFTREELLDGVEGEIQLLMRRKSLAQTLSVDTLDDRASASLLVDVDMLRRGPKLFFLSWSGAQAVFAYGASDKSPGASFNFSSLASEDIERIAIRRLTVTFSNVRTDKAEIATLLQDFIFFIFRDVLPLPAERKALVSLYPLIANGSRGTRRLPVPLEDLLNRWQGAHSVAKHSRSSSLSRPVSELSRRFATILGGDYRFTDRDGEPQLEFVCKNGPSVPIRAASSLAKSLASLLVLEQRLERGNEAVVVDEPEMNAHPSAQLAIMEYLAALATLGTYVVATTHSPYCLDHVNNLLAGGELPRDVQAKIAHRLALRSVSSLIPAGKVSAYEFARDGSVQTFMDDSRNRLDAAAFGHVSSRIENLYSELLEKKGQ